MSETNLNILIVSPWVTRHGGGVAEAVRLAATVLSQGKGHKVEVLSLSEKDGSSALEGWGESKVRTFSYFGPSKYRLSVGLFWHLIWSDADIVHVHGIWTFQCLAALMWSVLRGRPYVVSPHGMLEEWILRRSRFLKGVVSRLYQNAFLKRAAAFHVLTEKERQDVARFAPEVTCHVIPNFVQPPTASPKSPPWWKPDYDERTIFLFLGRIHVKKGWEELCDAWEKLSASNPSFARDNQLVFCGWLDESPHFEGRIAQLEAEFGNVTFAGPQYGEGRRDSLAAADVFVLPSRSEGLPMVILEAWAAGLPVIMTDECNLPVGFQAGAAIKVGLSADQVAGGLKDVADMGAEARKKMGEAGKALVKREFSAAAAKRQLVNMYRACLKPSKRAARGNAAK